MSTLSQLRAYAVSESLFHETSLNAAIRRMGFVQADPIRSPARAQDLILRHRVKAYRAGDLERHYTSLDLEEDILYAYGFLPRKVWQLLHPRDVSKMSKLETKVLEAVRNFGVLHPNELQAHFGNARVVNAWGGYSKATTHALEHLHYRGLVRVARRENGIRLYQAMPARVEDMPARERLRKLILVVAKILEPVSEKNLHANIARFRYLGNTRTVIDDLMKAGEIEKQAIDGIKYLRLPATSSHEESPRRVRFLAPFDPLVWDRSRFEHFWGWRYRFEAYTPAAKRVRGYYAMPLLWADSVVGWANARVDGERLDVDVGFVRSRPRDAEFPSELDAEIARLEGFLKLNSSTPAGRTPVPKI